MITKKQLKELKVKVDAAAAALNDLKQEIEDENYEETYNETTEKQQETDKYNLLSELMEVYQYEWADKLDGIQNTIDNMLEPTEKNG